LKYRIQLISDYHRKTMRPVDTDIPVRSFFNFRQKCLVCLNRILSRQYCELISGNNREDCMRLIDLSHFLSRCFPDNTLTAAGFEPDEPGTAFAVTVTLCRSAGLFIFFFSGF